MRCEEAGNHLVAFLHHELTVPHQHALERHFNGCAACREDLETSRHVMRSLRHIELREPPADVITQTVETARAAAIHRHSSDSPALPRRMSRTNSGPYLQSRKPLDHTQRSNAVPRTAIHPKRRMNLILLSVFSLILGAAGTFIWAKYLRAENPIASIASRALARDVLRREAFKTKRELLPAAGWKIDTGACGILTVLPQQNPATGENFLALYRDVDIVQLLNGLPRASDFFRQRLATASKIRPTGEQYTLPADAAAQVFGSDARLVLLNIPGRRLELWSESALAFYMSHDHPPLTGADDSQDICGPSVPGVPDE